MNTLKNPLLIVANGEFPSNEIAIKQIKECNSIIACDGAANTLINRGYKPDIIIPEIEAIAVNALLDIEKQGITVIKELIRQLNRALNYQ